MDDVRRLPVWVRVQGGHQARQLLAREVAVPLFFAVPLDARGRVVRAHLPLHGQAEQPHAELHDPVRDVGRALRDLPVEVADVRVRDFRDLQVLEGGLDLVRDVGAVVPPRRWPQLVELHLAEARAEVGDRRRPALGLLLGQRVLAVADLLLELRCLGARLDGGELVRERAER